VALVSVSLTQFQNINESLSSLVEETHIKLQAANTMRDAIRLRADSLKKMRLLDDPFVRDEEYISFINYAQDFRNARERLTQIPMNPSEVAIMEKLTETLRIAQPVNEQAAQKLFDYVRDDSFLVLIEKAESLQHELLNLLDALVVIENQSAQAALVRANSYYKNTKYTLFALATVVSVMVIAIAIIVIRQVGSKNQQVSYQAMHDPLTNLYNRCYFEHQVHKSIQQCNKTNSPCALLFMDLDQFKVVNDTCGHMAGDELLRQITELLQTKVRKSDTLARLGGDEFGLLLTNCDVVRATLLAEDLRKHINEFRFLWDDKIFSVGVSIGIAAIDRQITELKEALIAADTACYAAKDAGRNQVHIYDPQEKKSLENKFQIEWLSEIKSALQENRLLLYAQSMVTLETSSSSGPKFYEILVRLQAQDGKLYPPGAFFPAAERYGLITEIDRWVVKNTFEFIASNKNISSNSLFFLNLSGRSFMDNDFKYFLQKLFRQYNISGQRICFEMSESEVITAIDKTRSFVNEFREIGCQFSVDDFGSGLSSFTYLKQLMVNFLKIDGSICQNIDTDTINYAMVKSINELAHLYGKKTVAKNVESYSVMKKVADLGIDFAQGYEIAHPADLTEISS